MGNQPSSSLTSSAGKKDTTQQERVSTSSAEEPLKLHSEPADSQEPKHRHEEGETATEEQEHQQCPTPKHLAVRLNHLKTPSFSGLEETFKPYVRLQESSSCLYEVIRTGIVLVTLFPLRVAMLLVHIFLFLMIASMATFGLRKDDKAPFQPISIPRAMLMMMFKPLARSLLFWVFGIYQIKRTKVTWEELPKIPDQDPVVTSPARRPYVIVANHLGYVDILVLLATHGGAFVAKGAIAKTPIVGTVANALQTLYVREGQPLTQAIINRVRTTYDCHLDRGHEHHHGRGKACGSCLSTLTIFPEGTTTNGAGMVKFRTGVFAAGRPVLPVAVRFPYTHFNPSWETIRFGTHIFRMLTQVWNRAEVAELPFYHPSARERADARRYAENVQALLAAALGQEIHALNRKQKFVYHKKVLGKFTEEEALKEARRLYEEDKLLQPLFVV